MDYEAVILDMDGVITDTAGLHARAWKRMFDDYLRSRTQRTGEPYAAFDIDTDYPQYLDGKPRYQGVASFLDSRGIELPWGDESDPPDRETVCGLGNRKNELFRELLQQQSIEIYPDAVEQIKRWRKGGIKTAVISSSRNCTRILENAGLLGLFDVKLDGNDAERLGVRGKPFPDVFLHAAEQLGVEPAQAVVIEDAIAGIQAGRRGKFGLVIGVARQGRRHDLEQAGADQVLGDLRSLSVDEGDSTRRPASALQNREQIGNRLRQQRLGLFLDYDGTLTPIVDRPEDATLSDSMRRLLAELAARCTLAVVSGRDRKDVEQMVGLPELVYAGSHGFDIRGPGGLQLQREEAERCLPDLDEAERRLKDQLQHVEGARVERKRFAIAVHYRQTPEEKVAKVQTAVRRIADAIPSLRPKGGKKIFELQPDIEWDKGQAVLWLREVLGLDDPGVVTIYIGDDVTDEDAFRALAEGERGLGIRVGDLESETAATYSLGDTDQVETFLRYLLPLLNARD